MMTLKSNLFPTHRRDVRFPSAGHQRQQNEIANIAVRFLFFLHSREQTFHFVRRKESIALYFVKRLDALRRILAGPDFVSDGPKV